MASATKLAANRRNARRSTGPRTAKGKAVSARNAVRHGLLSKLPVLPEIEHQDDWDAHLRHTIESINPVGYLEMVLSERVALILWRLRRLANSERGAGAINLRRAIFERSIEPWMESKSLYRAEKHARSELHIVERDLAILQFARQLEPKSYVDPETAARVVRRMADVGDLEADCPEIRERFGEDVAPDLELEELPWTVGTLIETVGEFEGATGIDAEAALQEGIDAAESKLADVIEQIASRRQEKSVLPADPGNLLTRYETTLERSLYRTIHEIERLQAHRTGGDVPPPAVLDVTSESVPPAD